MMDKPNLLYVYSYASYCGLVDPAGTRTVQSIDIYTTVQQWQALAELGYYHQHGTLPAWGYLLETIEETESGNLYVWADTSTFA